MTNNYRVQSLAQNSNRRRARLFLLLSSAATLCIAGSPVAFAADSAAEVAAASGGGHLDEVIVTARKKDENIQNVPVAVTALSGKQLDRFALNSIEKISSTTPQLVVTRGNSGSGANISLHGIGSSFTSIGIEQSVAVDIDGVYYGQGRVLNEALFDMKQVEVLKGPQALFFGKNASAGVISFTTADPGKSFEAMGRAGYEFTANEPMVEGFVSGPVAENLGMRLAVHYSDMRGGYVNNLAPATTYNTFDIATFTPGTHADPAPDKKAPQEKDLVGRFTLKYEPTAQLTATLKASLDQYRVLDATWNSLTVFCPTGSRQTAPGEPCGKNWNIYQNNLPADVAATNPIAGRHGGKLYQDYDSQSVTGDIRWAGDKVSVDSVTGFHHFVNYFLGDYDLTGAVNSPAGTWGIERSEYRAFSTELRAQTKFAGPVNGMVGAYYQNTQLDFNQDVIFPGGLEDSSLADVANRYVTVEKLSRTRGQTFAGFAQVIWDIDHDLEFTAGARYTHETKISFFKQPYVVAPYQAVFRQYNPADPTSIILGDQTFDNLSPEATLTWKPASNLTAYMSYKTGYKSGGFSGSALNTNPLCGGCTGTLPNDLMFKPETPKGVEAGVKSTLLGGSLRLDVDAYDYVYQNFQVDFFDSVHIQYLTKNVGQAESRGIEAQADWAPDAVPGLTLNAVIGFNDAYYKSFRNAPCYGGETIAEGCSVNPANGLPEQNLTGSPTSDAPKWTGSLEADYEHSLAGGLMLGLTGNAHVSSSYHLTQFGYAADSQPAYATFDASVRLGDDKKRWEVALIGKNLTNQFILTSGLDVPSTGSGTGTAAGVHSDIAGTPQLPRTIAVQFTMRF